MADSASVRIHTNIILPYDRTRSQEVAQLLIAHGASVAGRLGEHILWCAVSRGHREIVNLLMDQGARLVPWEPPAPVPPDPPGAEDGGADGEEGEE